MPPGKKGFHCKSYEGIVYCYGNSLISLSLQCTVCRRQFTTLYNLNSHKKLHDRPNIFTCSIEQCNADFQTQRELDNHLKVCSIPDDIPSECS